MHRKPESGFRTSRLGKNPNSGIMYLAKPDNRDAAKRNQDWHG